MKIRFGIMGPGNIAKRFAKAILSTEKAELYAVASRDEEKAKRFSAQFGGKVFYGNYEQLAKDENVDIVYIAVVHNYHKDLIKLALENGKAVICEKPLAIDFDECLEVINLAKENDLLLMEGMWSRFFPAYKKAKQWVSEGKIGDILMINSSFGFRGNMNPNGRLYNKATAGGALLDVGCYTTAFSLDFAGENPVTTKSVSRIGETGVDLLGSTVMLFKSGMIANSNFAIDTKTLHDGFIFGEKGRIELKCFWNCKEARLFDENGELIETFKDESEKGFEYEIEHVCDLFIEGKTESGIMSHKNTLDCMNVMDQIKDNFEDYNHDYDDMKNLDY